MKRLACCTRNLLRRLRSGGSGDDFRRRGIKKGRRTYAYEWAEVEEYGNTGLYEELAEERREKESACTKVKRWCKFA